MHTVSDKGQGQPLLQGPEQEWGPCNWQIAWIFWQLLRDNFRIILLAREPQPPAVLSLHILAPTLVTTSPGFTLHSGRPLSPSLLNSGSSSDTRQSTRQAILNHGKLRLKQLMSKETQEVSGAPPGQAYHQLISLCKWFQRKTLGIRSQEGQFLVLNFYGDWGKLTRAWSMRQKIQPRVKHAMF